MVGSSLVNYIDTRNFRIGEVSIQRTDSVLKKHTVLAAVVILGAGCISVQPSEFAPRRLPVSQDNETIPAALALATFDSVWHIVQRTYVDTAFVASRWSVVRESVRPLAAVTTSRHGLDSVLTATLKHIPDSHFYIIPSTAAADVSAAGDVQSGEGTTGMSVRIAAGNVVVWRVEPGSPAALAGISPGLGVEQIGDRVTMTSIARVASLPDVSRQRGTSQLLQKLNRALSPSAGDTVRVRLAGLNAARAFERRLVATKVAGTVSKFGNLPPLAGRVSATRRTLSLTGQSNGQACIGTVAFNIWLPALAPELERAVKGVASCIGIVIDLRGNPGGVGAMVMGFGGYFVESPLSLGTMRTRDVSLRFVINPRSVHANGAQGAVYSGPVAILVDPMTASTSEIFATGMQRLGRMRVFGERSAGAALPSLMEELPSGDVFVHAIADFTDPDGRRIEGAGVVPDESLPVTEKDLLLNVDAPFEAAVRWISAQAAARRSMPRTRDSSHPLSWPAKAGIHVPLDSRAK